jgi:hypothetical protein
MASRPGRENRVATAGTIGQLSVTSPSATLADSTSRVV